MTPANQESTARKSNRIIRILLPAKEIWPHISDDFVELPRASEAEREPWPFLGLVKSLEIGSVSLSMTEHHREILKVSFEVPHVLRFRQPVYWDVEEEMTCHSDGKGS